MASEKIAEALQFNPRIWWDPPPWPWLLQQLDERVLTEITIAQLEFQREVLGAQVKATDRILGILAKNAER